MDSQRCAHCKRVFVPDYAGKKFCGRECWRAFNPRTYHDKTCPTCGERFKTKDSRQRFCNRKCLHAHQSKLFANRVTLTCKECGKTYDQKPALRESSLFCSLQCKHKNRTTEGIVSVECAVCTTLFTRLKSDIGDFCSYECSGFAKRNRIEKRCAICERLFQTIPSHADLEKCCSRECGRLWSRRFQTEVTCTECGQKYMAAPSAVKKGTAFCSKACQHRHNGPTSIEKMVYDALVSLGIEFIPEFHVGRYWIDAYLPSLFIALEVDGDYWHSLPAQIARDNRKDAFLKTHGLHVVRITQSELLSCNSTTSLVQHKLNLIEPG